MENRLKLLRGVCYGLVFGIIIGGITVRLKNGVPVTNDAIVAAYLCGTIDELKVKAGGEDPNVPVTIPNLCQHERSLARAAGFHDHDCLDIHVGTVKIDPKGTGL